MAIIDEGVILDQFILYPAYPNPFNPKTTIRFNIGVEKLRATSLQIFDISGRMVETIILDNYDQGIHKVSWDGSHFPSSIYFVVLSVNNKKTVQKFTLLK